MPHRPEYNTAEIRPKWQAACMGSVLSWGSIRPETEPSAEGVCPSGSAPKEERFDRDCSTARVISEEFFDVWRLHTDLHHYLRSRFQCRLENRQLILFEMRTVV
jgi:hypothetical protein